MSYNIDNVCYLSGKLFIRAGTLNRLWREHYNHLPEDCFLTDLDGEDGEVLVIECPTWRAESSGASFDLFQQVLSQTTGEADILVCWEGGDKYTGLRVRDGKVEEKGVRMVLEQ